MPTLRIDAVRTVNQFGQNATLFNPISDALALTLDVFASGDLLALPSPSWSARVQVIDPVTNAVVVNRSWGGTFQWGQRFWISMGNNWGPPDQYTTIERWGLSWVALGIFGFRGVIKAYSSPGGGAGLQTVDAFFISKVKWFRAKEVFRL